jgi:hypothetical protein
MLAFKIARSLQRPDISFLAPKLQILQHTEVACMLYNGDQSLGCDARHLWM